MTCSVTLICATLANIAYFLDAKVEEESNQKEPSPNISTTKRLILHFSPKQNLAYLYDTSTRPQSIPMLFGLKSISCITILCYHTQWYGFFAMKNKAHMFHQTEKLAHQWVSNAPYLVDIFFVISGFLLTYNFLKNQHQMEQIKNDGLIKNLIRFGRMVLQRYLRLVPMYFVTLLSLEILFSFLADTSNFYLQERFDLHCQQHWWRSILFIQNFFGFENMCGSWTWSLACEMQYYILFLFVLFTYVKSKGFGLVVFFALASTIFVIMLGVTLELKFVPTVDAVFATGNELYTNTFTRMAPYFSGVAGGWIYATFKGKSTRMSMKYMRQIAILSGLIILLTMHSTVKRDGDYRVQSSVFVVGRWVYSVSIISLILVNLFGYQSFLTRLLSAKFFVHFSKLDYAIYLVNPMVVSFISGVSDENMALDLTSLYSFALVVLVISYGLAVLITSLFELPISKLVDEVFPKKAT